MFLSQCNARGIRNSGCFPRRKRAAIVRRYRVFFRNPPNSDMDYSIFNVRTFLCVRVHTGAGHTDESAHFDSGQLSQDLQSRDDVVVFCPPGGFVVNVTRVEHLNNCSDIGHTCRTVSNACTNNYIPTAFAHVPAVTVWSSVRQVASS